MISDVVMSSGHPLEFFCSVEGRWLVDEVSCWCVDVDICVELSKYSFGGPKKIVYMYSLYTQLWNGNSYSWLVIEFLRIATPFMQKASEVPNWTSAIMHKITTIERCIFEKKITFFHFKKFLSFNISLSKVFIELNLVWGRAFLIYQISIPVVGKWNLVSIKFPMYFVVCF